MDEAKNAVDIRDMKLSIIERLDGLKMEMISLVNIIFSLQSKLDTACQEPKPVE